MKRMGMKWFMLAAASLLCLATAGLWAAGSAGQAPDRTVTVQVTDRALAQQLLKEGRATLVADYGGFHLLKAEEPVAEALQKSGAGELRPEYRYIMLNSGWIDTSAQGAKAKSKPIEAAEGNRLRLIQFAGPVQPQWYESLLATGVRVVTYIPSNAYLVFGDTASLNHLQKMAASSATVAWEGDYQPAYKVDRSLVKAAEMGVPPADLYTIQILKDSRLNSGTLGLIDAAKLKPIANQWEMLGYVNVVVSLPYDAVNKLAARPDLVSIQPYSIPVKMDERQDMIVSGNLAGNVPSGPGYLTWLASKGFTQAQFTASGFGVDVSDSGIDNATTSPNHFGLYVGGDPSAASRVVYNRLEGTPNSGSTLQGCDGHGTLNSHIVSGYVPTAAPFDAAPHMDSAGYHYGLGVAPFVKVGSSVIFDPGTFTNPNYANLQSEAYHDGMRLSTNSWGANVSGQYNSDSQAYDALVRDAQPAGSTYPTAGNQEMVIVFSAGNSGPSSGTIGSPGTAKNVITSGASENVQAFGAADQCGVTDAQADSANDVIGFSSRGPCLDGRKKPDFMAPGTHVSGGVFQATKVSPVSGTGAASACFDATGVCAGPGTSNFWPLSQQWYTASSGTSHSCPAMAGGAALVRQYFLNQAFSAPSPAMTKGYLMNSARYMTGVSAGDTLWSNSQGMGMMDLGMAFDGVARVLRDQVGADMFTATGQSRVFTGTVVDNTKPFRVTLAWTDAPGATTGAAYKNDLDLTVTVGGNTYKGNVFTGANSSTGGVADNKDNVESVFVPAGVTGNFVVSIGATNINSQGDPAGPTLNQDFALVIYNASSASLPVVAAAGSALTAEGCVPANGVPDPGETVTYSLSLQNVGTADTTNLVATLQATGGVTSPSAAQTYGVLTAGGAAVARSFTFTADPALTCGATITATLQLQDGSANLGTVTYTFQAGVPVVGLSENFDGVTPPAIPAGWAASLGSGAANWVTTNASSDTSPNSAFGPDLAAANDARLDSPSFSVSTASAPLTFRHKYGLESGFDGAVLEISIGGGAFQDIVTAGGSFNSGGYTGTISSSFGNPLGGRSAWTGTLSSFSTVSVNLPAAAQGQNVVLRWRVASDSSVSDTGWFVDTISVINGVTCCGYTAPPVIQANGASLTAENCSPANGVPDPGETVTYDLGLKNVGLGASTNLVATLQATGGVLSPSGPQTYGAIAPDGTQTRSFTFTVNPALACGGTVTVTLALQDGALDLGTVTYTLTLGTTVIGSPTTFTNPAAITIPSSGAATPYPSTIAVSGLTGTVAKVTATLTGASHTWPDDINVLLVGPAGQKMVLWQNAGGSSAITGVTLTFDDAAASFLPDAGPIVSGTFKPSQYGSVATYPAPAPAGPYGTALSAFNGTAPNGTWSLYVFDDTAGDAGSISGGWSLSITPQVPVCCISCPTITLAPSTLPEILAGVYYSQTITASGGTAPYTYAVTAGALPSGLTLSSGGVLSGTTTAGGSFGFTVTATDSAACTGSQAYSFYIQPYNLSFLDDQRRSQVCVNSTTGAWQYTVLSGAGMGTYTGTGTATGGVAMNPLQIMSSPSSPYRFTLTYWAPRGTASATFRSGGFNSSLSDRNTKDDPPCGGNESN